MQSAAAVSAGFLGLKHASVGLADATGVLGRQVGYGPLMHDPQGVIDLPSGFTYRVINQAGREMDDGLIVPGKQDGAAAFAGPDGLTIHICNHEVNPMLYRLGPYGWNLERLDLPDPAKVYDRGHGKTPGLGGCTTTVYDTRTGKVHRRYMSLIGTERNCAGGPTPWDSWISCEETVSTAGEISEKDHGYCFEVPASAEIAPADPIALIDMGRFNHEAVAVDPNTGIVYLTEDRQDGSFYRFIPRTPGKLHEGGKLQALALTDQVSHDTRNWLGQISAEEAAKYEEMGTHAVMDAEDFSPHRTPINEMMPVHWIDVENVTSPRDDLRRQTFAKGAARFARGEGMWWSQQAAYFACTTGGVNRKGQIFRYVPSPLEGQPGEDSQPGQLEIYLEPNDHELVANADNLTFAPWGDMIICEDRGKENDVVGVTPEGRIYKLAHNTLSRSEFAGACFSPDGTTLFVNIQGNGITLAITGPWQPQA